MHLISAMTVLTLVVVTLVAGHLGVNVATTTMPGVCVADPQCECGITSDWSIYRDFVHLENVKNDTKDLQLSIDGSSAKFLYKQVVNVSARITDLERVVDGQPISYTLQELMDLQRITDDMVANAEKLNKTGGAQKEMDKIRDDLGQVKTDSDGLWKKNPYADKDKKDEELTNLREHVDVLEGNQKWTAFDGDNLPVDFRYDDWCDKHELASIGSAVTHKYGAAYGSWFKDPAPVSELNRTEIFVRDHRSGSAQTLYRYNNYTDFQDNKGKTPYQSHIMDGIGYVLYDQAIFWEYSGYLHRYGLQKGTYVKKQITRRTENYLGNTLSTYVDLKVDEYGLWAIMSTDDNQNRLVINRVDPYDLSFKETYKTARYKSSVCAVFMACGTMYTLDVCTNRVEQDGNIKQYMYNTRTKKDNYENLQVLSKFGHIYSLNYNPRERTLFGWDYYHLVSYPITWTTLHKD